MTKRSTIYELAAMAGCSPSAVSAVPNNRWQTRRIGSELAEKITTLAADTGYIRNNAARSLRGIQTGIVALIVPSIIEAYFAALAEQFELNARSLGYRPIVTSLDGAKSLETAILSLNPVFVSVAGSTDTEALVEVCRTASVPCIVIDNETVSSPCIVSGRYEASFSVTCQLDDDLTKQTEKPVSLLYLGTGKSTHTVLENRRGFNDACRSMGHVPTYAAALDGQAIVSALRKSIVTMRDAYLGIVAESTAELAVALKFFQAEKPGQMVFGLLEYAPLASILCDRLRTAKFDTPGLVSDLFSLFESSDVSPRSLHVPPLGKTPATRPLRNALSIGRTSSLSHAASTAGRPSRLLDAKVNFSRRL